ncbi:hypothetical protein DICA1_F32484 [Diutina catenulata]
MLILPLEIVREIVLLLDAVSVSSLILAINSGKRYSYSSAKRIRLSSSRFCAILPVLWSVLPNAALHINPHLTTQQDYHKQLPKSGLSMAVSKFSWTKIPPWVLPRLHQLELVDGFFDDSVWKGDNLVNLTILELHGMKIKRWRNMPPHIMELTMVDCVISGGIDLVELPLRKVELFRGDGSVVLPPSVEHLVNGRMWVTFSAIPKKMVKLNDWTDTRRDVIGALVTNNWFSLRELSISSSWKLPDNLPNTLTTLESGEESVPSSWLPQLRCLGVDVGYWHTNSQVWDARDLTLDLNADDSIQHITSLTIFVNEPGISIISLPPRVQTVWIEGEEDCEVKKVDIKSSALKSCTIYFCQQVILDCPRIQELELSYCEGGLPNGVKIPQVVTEVSIDASDQSNRLVKDVDITAATLKLVGCMFHAVRLRARDIHLEGCSFDNVDIRDCLVLELNIVEPWFVDIFTNQSSSFLLTSSQLKRLLPPTLLHLEYRNPNLDEVIRGNEFAHLDSLRHLSLSCRRLGTLVIPANVRELVLEDMTISYHQSMILPTHLDTIALKKCHYTSLEFDNLGSPPELKWLFVAKCPESCCRNSTINYASFPPGCTVRQTHGISMLPRWG